MIAWRYPNMQAQALDTFLTFSSVKSFIRLFAFVTFLSFNHEVSSICNLLMNALKSPNCFFISFQSLSLPSIKMKRALKVSSTILLGLAKAFNSVIETLSKPWIFSQAYSSDAYWSGVKDIFALEESDVWSDSFAGDGIFDSSFSSSCAGSCLDSLIPCEFKIL